MSVRKTTQYRGDVVMLNHVLGLLKTHGFIVDGLGGP